MLAGELRLGGLDVVVLEKRHVHTDESRASTLHARTMEILDSRGLLTHFGTPPNETRGHFGGIPLDLTLPSPYPGQWKVPQTRTEAVLEEWALSLGADIRCGHELRALSEARAGQGQYVQAEAAGRDGIVHVRGEYLVACDGEDSTVRLPSAPSSRATTPVANCCAPTSRASPSPTGASTGCRRAWPSRPAATTA